MDAALTASINNVEPRRRVRRWLSAGAVISMTTWPVIGHLTSDRDLWSYLFKTAGLVKQIAEQGFLATLLPPALILTLLALAMLAGSAFAARIWGGRLAGLPRPALFGLGFFLGLGLAAVGVIGLIFVMMVNLLRLDQDFDRQDLADITRAPRPVKLFLFCILAAPIVGGLAIYFIAKMGLAVIFPGM